MSCWQNCCYLISIIWLFFSFLKNTERAKTEKHGLCHRGLQQFVPHCECLPKNRSCMCAWFSHNPIQTTMKKIRVTGTDWLLVTLNPDTFCPMKRIIISSISYDLTLTRFPTIYEWCNSTDYDHTLKKRHLIVWMVMYAYWKSLGHYYYILTFGYVFTISPPQKWHGFWDGRQAINFCISCWNAFRP